VWKVLAVSLWCSLFYLLQQRHLATLLPDSFP
jgi:hypothetical protein